MLPARLNHFVGWRRVMAYVLLWQIHAFLFLWLLVMVQDLIPVLTNHGNGFRGAVFRVSIMELLAAAWIVAARAFINWRKRSNHNP
jgi:hypothetical protein